MTTQIELLDALPGCGKTYAITKYMSENRDRPWLYLSPLASEVYPAYDDMSTGEHKTVVEKAGEYGLHFVHPSDGNEANKSEQVLEMLQEGLDVACTHNLMLRFTKQHIEAIALHKYNVVCDETLDLLSGYNMSTDDYNFLKKQELISINPENGRVSFTDVKMGSHARYSDVKLLCDLGCLFAAPRSDRMLVTQLSTDLLKEANRFVLITYNYENSLMDNFLSLHGFTCKRIDYIATRITNKEAKDRIIGLLNILELPSVLTAQRGSSGKLSKTWWSNASAESKDQVISAIGSCARKVKALKKEDIIFTLPKDVIEPQKKTSYKITNKFISKDSWLACNCRATNEYSKAILAVQAYNLYPNVAVVAYLQDMGCKIDQEKYALNMLIQWLWRGCIRNGEPMNVALLSKRMSLIFKDWLCKVDVSF